MNQIRFADNWRPRPFQRRLLMVVFCIFRFGVPVTADSPAEPTDAGLAFFESKIRPVLVAECYECHSQQAGKAKGGLTVDTREAIRQGGESGHAVIPGNVEESLLLSALRHESFEMPPSKKLDDSVIDAFQQWIEMGAPDPRDSLAETASANREIDLESARTFWAFQPVVRPEVPVVESNWPLNDVDRFVLVKQQEHQLTPVADAERRAWLRRVTFDLTGLPPTPQQVQAFLVDDSPNAYAAVVDRLLDSPQFGEHWGRHWLDVARYADSIGKTRNYPYSHAWRYRNYVIDAFNADKPYDTFLREQLAGDLLPADSNEDRAAKLIATGFLALGSHDLNERNREQFAMDVVGEQIDVTSRAIMGLTVGCARCHDHKFDPIPTNDYYALAGIFRSTELLMGYGNRIGGNNQEDGNRYHSLSETALASREPVQSTVADDSDGPPDAAQANRIIKQLQKRRKSIQQDESLRPVQKQRRLQKLNQNLKQAQKQLKQLRQKRDAAAQPVDGPVAMGVRDARRIADSPVHVRGDTGNLGEVVPRGFLQVILPTERLGQTSMPVTLPKNSSGRLELADWLTSGDHPLTARVMVNRIWSHLFGEGIVRTVDNFGEMGQRPSHPELLDFLASEFMDQGWSVKQLIRQITLSRTYRLSTTDDDGNASIDGDNQFLWRMNRRRLEAEAIRDAMLA
ncbi:MAG: DUF1549 domain-containing protein, partial [Planctomycetales bacterium]|nr:DUF1549 domain-containing protein [Planctomycetales bacterium]